MPRARLLRLVLRTEGITFAGRWCTTRAGSRRETLSLARVSAARSAARIHIPHPIKRSHPMSHSYLDVVTRTCKSDFAAGCIRDCPNRSTPHARESLQYDTALTPLTAEAIVKWINFAADSAAIPQRRSIRYVALRKSWERSDTVGNISYIMWKLYRS